MGNGLLIMHVQQEPLRRYAGGVWNKSMREEGGGGGVICFASRANEVFVSGAEPEHDPAEQIQHLEHPSWQAFAPRVDQQARRDLYVAAPTTTCVTQQTRWALDGTSMLLHPLAWTQISTAITWAAQHRHHVQHVCKQDTAQSSAKCGAVWFGAVVWYLCVGTVQQTIIVPVVTAPQTDENSNRFG